MKKVSKILIAMIVCIVSALTLTACGNKVTSVTVKSGTIATTIVKDGTIDTSKAIVIIKYSDGKIEEVGADQLTFGTIDTSTVGDKTLIVTYDKKDYNVTIKVVATEADVNSIASLESELLTEYNNNKKTQTNKQEEFYDSTQPLYVGDDNAFNFRINASGVDGSGNLVTDLTKVRTVITVEQKGSDGNYTTLTGDDLTAMVEIDTENTTLDFTEAAIGKEFRVTVVAANRDLEYEENATKFTANLTVIDGYNVYNAKDLCLYDTLNIDGRWTGFKQANGYANVSVNGLILQGDINITREDVADGFFWKTTDPGYATAQSKTNQTLEGSLKDLNAARGATALYARSVNNGDVFNFIGNYFSVNASAFPKMLVERDNSSGVVTGEDEEYMTGHTCIFFTDAHDGATMTADTHVYWKNLFFIGNGEMNADPLNSGSILLMKNDYVNFNAYNTITHNFYIGYFLQLGNTSNPNDGNYVVEKCKGYNSFQCLFYFYGAENVLIKDSEFLNAGGPAIIADHVDPDSEGKGGNPTHINIVNSKIEAKLSGQEPWFAQYNASIVAGQLRQLDALYAADLLADQKATIAADYVKNASGEDVSRLNIVVVMKSGGTQGLTNVKISGWARMFNSEADYNKYYGYNEETQSQTTYGLELNFEDSLMKKAFDGSVYLESNGNGGYSNSGVQTNEDTSMSLNKSYSKGNYVNVYMFNGMGAVLGLYPVQA